MDNLTPYQKQLLQSRTDGSPYRSGAGYRPSTKHSSAGGKRDESGSVYQQSVAKKSGSFAGPMKRHLGGRKEGAFHMETVSLDRKMSDFRGGGQHKETMKQSTHMSTGMY